MVNAGDYQAGDTNRKAAATADRRPEQSGLPAQTAHAALGIGGGLLTLAVGSAVIRLHRTVR